MTAPGGYAGTVSRATAFLIDALLATFGTLAGALCFALVKALFADRFSIVGTASPDAVFAAVPVVFLAYCATAWTLTGRSVGKALLGLRVIDHAGARPSLLRSIVRALSYLLSAILWLGFLWIAVDRRHDGLHDKIARTHVVYER